MKRTVICCLLAAILHSCHPVSPLVRLEGDQAQIRMRDGREIKAELITVREGNLYIKNTAQKGSAMPGGLVYKIPAPALQQVKILKYANTRWIGAWVATQLVPTFLLALSAYRAETGNAGPIFFIFMIPTTASGTVLALTTPRSPTFSSDSLQTDLSCLKKYTRYPQNLSDRQFDTFLKSGHQTVVETLAVPEE